MFIFHTQINISCKKCNIVAIPIFNQFTAMYMPKHLKDTPTQVLIQLRHCGMIIKIIKKKDNKDCENSTNCWICCQVYGEHNVQIGDHCHITGIY